MKSLYFILIFLLIGCGQDVHKEQKMKLNWDVESVRVYGSYDLGEMKRVADKDLQSQKNVIVKDERLTALFRSAIFDKRWSIWKGGDLGLVNLKDGRIVRIAISNYGGYFHIAGQTGFYFFDNSKDRELWEYLFFGQWAEKWLKESNPNSKA